MENNVININANGFSCDTIVIETVELGKTIYSIDPKNKLFPLITIDIVGVGESKIIFEEGVNVKLIANMKHLPHFILVANNLQNIT